PSACTKAPGRKPKRPRSRHDQSHPIGGDQMSVAAAQHVPGTTAPATAEPVRSKKLTPYFLLLPMALVLIIFFVLPILTLLNNSLTTGGLEEGYTFTFQFSNYWEVWTE